MVQADLAVTREQVQVKDMVATLLQGRFRGHGILNLVDPDRSWAEVAIEQVPVAALLGPLSGAADRLDARVTLTARTPARAGAPWGRRVARYRGEGSTG